MQWQGTTSTGGNRIDDFFSLGTGEASAKILAHEWSQNTA